MHSRPWRGIPAALTRLLLQRQASYRLRERAARRTGRLLLGRGRAGLLAVRRVPVDYGRPSPQQNFLNYDGEFWLRGVGSVGVRTASWPRMGATAAFPRPWKRNRGRRQGKTDSCAGNPADTWVWMDFALCLGKGAASRRRPVSSANLPPDGVLCLHGNPLLKVAFPAPSPGPVVRHTNARNTAQPERQPGH